MDSKEIRKFLWGHLSPHKKWLLLSVLFASMLSLSKVWLSYLMKPLFDKALIPQDFSLIKDHALLLIALVFADGLFSYFHRVYLRIGAERTTLDIKNRLFQKMLIFSQKQWAKLDSGRAVTHLFSDTTVITQGLHIASDIIRQPLTILGLLGYLLYMNWKLTLLCLIMAPSVGYVARKLGQSSKRNQKRIQHAQDKVAQHSLEAIQGLRTAHAFGQLALLKDEFDQKIFASYKPTVKQASVQEVIAPISKLLFGATGALLIIAGGYFVANGEMTVGALLSFMVAAGQLQDPIRQLNHVHVRMQEVYASSERILGVLEQPLDTVSQSQQNLLTSPPQKPSHTLQPLPLVFRNVSFAYSSDLQSPQAVSSVSFSVAPGKKIALVGPSGSGKSTLSLLSMRYLDPTQGNVELGSRPAADWPLQDYRAHFSYVSQDVFLFSKSLRENLLFANPAATEAELWTALEKARLKNFVESLPLKLDTPLQERAVNLSGGEKQRIAIARAILRNAPIVILDEATSQLDIENETLIHQAMHSLVEGKSVIIIAHRLSTVKEVDEILVLDHGKIREQGSPKDLIGKADSWFSRMWFTQGIS